MSPLDVPLLILGLTFLVALYRLAVGPTLPDRAVASEVVIATSIGGIALLAARLESTHFLDAVILASLLQFVGTLALAHLVERKDRT